jgi:UDP-glucose 4-epimerase
MKRVLVTGGTGFVGANLVRKLLETGHEVHLLLRPRTTDWRISGIRNDLRVHEASIEDREGVGRVVGDVRPEWIFHLAAYGAYSSQTDVRQMIATNITGTVNLTDACGSAGFDALVNAGSSSEYGFCDHAPRENEPIAPNSSYAATKATGTWLCSEAARTRGLNIRTLRLYSAYGPYEEPTRFIPTLISRGLQGKLPPLVNSETARDFIFVGDVVAACLAAASAPKRDDGAIYNVGTGVQKTVQQVVEVARELLGISEEPRWGTFPARDWDTKVWVADASKARRELGWSPVVDLREGLMQTIGWLRSVSADLRQRYELRS